MDIQKQSFLSIDQATSHYLELSKRDYNRPTQPVSFEEVLKSKQVSDNSMNLKFSKHASDRLNTRGISLSDNQLERLENGAIKASMKGIKDSLVIVDELAFIVNIPNQTVVTAMDQTQTEEHIFTNINGAVIM